jgi:hypothetical protein
MNGGARRRSLCACGAAHDWLSARARVCARMHARRCAAFADVCARYLRLPSALLGASPLGGLPFGTWEGWCRLEGLGPLARVGAAVWGAMGACGVDAVVRAVAPVGPPGAATPAWLLCALLYAAAACTPGWPHFVLGAPCCGRLWHFAVGSGGGGGGATGPPAWAAIPLDRVDGALRAALATLSPDSLGVLVACAARLVARARAPLALPCVAAAVAVYAHVRGPDAVDAALVAALEEPDAIVARWAFMAAAAAAPAPAGWLRAVAARDDACFAARLLG